MVDLTSQIRKIQRANEQRAVSHFHAQDVAMLVEDVDRLRFDREGGRPAWSIRVEPVTLQPRPRADPIPSLSDPATPALEPSPAQQGAPVSVTGSDYRRLAPDLQAQVRAQALNFPGARERLTSRYWGESLTLAHAFYLELDHQSSIQRGLSNSLKAGVTTRYSKTAAKRDRTKGAHQPRPAGPVKFSGPVYRVSTYSGKAIVLEPATIEVRKLRKIDKGLLQLNWEKDNV